MKNSYIIDFDIAAFILLSILAIILHFQYVKSSENNKFFRHFILAILISGILDIITAFTVSNADVIPANINYFLNSLYFLSTVTAGFLTERYISSFVKTHKKIHLIADYIIGGTYTLLLITNLFTGIIFDFKNGSYNKGPLFLANFIFPLLYLLHITSYLIFYRKSFSHKQIILNSTTVTFPIATAVLQFFYPQYLLTFFGESLFSLILLFTIETPDFLELEYLRKNLEDEIEKQTRKARDRQIKIQRMSIETIEALAQAIDAKDDYTNGHSERVSQYSVILANELKWSAADIENLKSAALLHDIGKIGIPDAVLQKPSKLTEEEFRIIKEHTIKGGKILHNVNSLPNAEIVAHYHHERYDGKGYPEGLSGKNIPAFARVVAIADAFDAMSTQRVYRDSLPPEEIRKRLIEGSGTQFDPDFLKIFIYLFDHNLLYLNK